MNTSNRGFFYTPIYIRDVPFRSGLVRSRLGAVPDKTGPFRSKLQPVRSHPVRCGPNQLAFHIKTVHSIPCRSWSGPVRSGQVQSGPVWSGLVRSDPFWSEFATVLHSIGPFRSKLQAGPFQSGPVWSGPVRSTPVRSGPVRSGPVRSGPVRSGPVRSGPVQISRRSA